MFKQVVHGRIVSQQFGSRLSQQIFLEERTPQLSLGGLVGRLQSSIRLHSSQ